MDVFTRVGTSIQGECLAPSQRKARLLLLLKYRRKVEDLHATARCLLRSLPGPANEPPSGLIMLRFILAEPSDALPAYVVLVGCWTCAQKRAG